jgi:hypothetical protein
VEIDTTHTTPGSAATKTAAATASGFWFIGQVAVDANGSFTVKQVLRSDVLVPSDVLPQLFHSADNPNSLTTGDDGLLWVPPIVSQTGINGSADNDLDTGDDGGAYYKTPEP